MPGHTVQINEGVVKFFSEGFVSIIPAAVLPGLHEHPPLLEALIWRMWLIGNGLICISVTNETGHHFHIIQARTEIPGHTRKM